MRNLITCVGVITLVGVLAACETGTPVIDDSSHEGLVSETVVHVHGDGTQTTAERWVTPDVISQERRVRAAT
jgi:hypothetical protein